MSTSGQRPQTGMPRRKRAQQRLPPLHARLRKHPRHPQQRLPRDRRAARTHGGSGDITARTPDDEKLHGVSERLFSKTGNGGVEETALRGRVSPAWLASQMGVPSLSGKYQFFYINGTSFANLVEDQEEPDHRYAEHHQPDNVDGDLYKISIWFEHRDDSNSQFNATQATMQRFLSGGQLKLARYRWNWERRAQTFPESNYQTIFDLVTAINSTADAGFVSRVLQQADMDQWMHVFAFHRVTGNWDSWTYNVGQNMYLYRQPGGSRAVPLGHRLRPRPRRRNLSRSDRRAGQRHEHPRLWTPTFRRMMWRAFARAIDGPLQPQNFVPVVEAYRATQLQDECLPGLSGLAAVTNYMNGRRSFLQTQYRNADPAAFAITSNGGANFTSASPTVTLAGTTPPHRRHRGQRPPPPVTWTSVGAFSISVPLTSATNDLRLVGLDRNGKALADVDTVRVVYTGAIPQARDWVVLNEVHYNPADPGPPSSNSTTVIPASIQPVGFRLDGIGYTFPANTTITPNGYLVLAANPAAFAARYGAGIAVLR